jgi:hypothetical protein
VTLAPSSTRSPYRIDDFHSVPVFFRELHVWWDDEKREIVLGNVTLASEDGFPSREEASEALDMQVLHRAREGFCHHFAPYPDHDLVGHSYTLVEI